MKNLSLCILILIPLFASAAMSDDLSKVVRLQNLVDIAKDNSNYDLACKAQSEIVDIVIKSGIRDMVQSSIDHKNAYCSVKKYSQLNYR